mmetsp:Transcript_86729/g.240564  ORF Transcript_86729/g.240564 Transcript_86729/m.240564 type:complete len:326 (-) Transcript_86729:169-1146(-)
MLGMNSALNAAGTAALNVLLRAQQTEAAGQKRGLEEALGAAAGLGQANKVGRVDTAFRGKGWTCPKCGNNNHDGRQVCNMRFCQAPRPMQLGEWLCTCGNVNYATRVQCGLRKCQLPRPNDPQIEQIISSVMGQVAAAQAGAGAVQGFEGSAARIVASTGSRAPPLGSWVCLACGNVNWPTRDTCNGRACGLPRADVDGGPYTPAVTALPAAMPTVPQSQQVLPEGSWSCLACGNINWPTRETCNRRTCGRPRAEVDSGQPVPATVPLVQNVPSQATPPEGSWVCIACNNINWPTRETCNKRLCGKPRAEVDGGPPLTASSIFLA